jgi:hypothetical protein
MFNTLEVHFVEPVTSPAVEVVVIRVKVSVVAYRPEALNSLQKSNTNQFGE